jgi:hypothetical protein
VEVTLTSDELFDAAVTGIRRACDSIRDGRKHAYGGQREAFWEIQIEGACGEAAVSKGLNVWWNKGVNTFKDVRDVGGKWEVRATTYRDGKLIVHPRDPDNAIFWLVVGKAPTYRLAGWKRGIDCKAQLYWADPQGGRPAYFVPQRELHSLEEFEIALAREARSWG